MRRLKGLPTECPLSLQSSQFGVSKLIFNKVGFTRCQASLEAIARGRGIALKQARYAHVVIGLALVVSDGFRIALGRFRQHGLFACASAKEKTDSFLPSVLPVRHYLGKVGSCFAATKLKK